MRPARDGWSRRRKLIVTTIVSLGVIAGALGGTAFATTISTSQRLYATPYTGGADLFDCASIQAHVQHSPPTDIAATVEVRGSYGVFCAAGAHSQLMKWVVQLSKQSGTLCEGPVASGYRYQSYDGYSIDDLCGNGTYYALTSSTLLIPLVAEYSSLDTNGGYPDIAGGMPYP